MSWLLTTICNSELKRDPIATAEELRSVFQSEQDYLYWIALVITGDDASAKKCLVDASGLSSRTGGVFHDWLWIWSGSATARMAANSMRETIGASVPHYLSMACDHDSHELLSEKQIRSICQLDPRQVISDLDPISRAMLVLRGFQGASVADCVLHLQIPRQCVIAAYCNVVRWVSETTRSVADYEKAAKPFWTILDAERRFLS